MNALADRIIIHRGEEYRLVSDAEAPALPTELQTILERVGYVESRPLTATDLAGLTVEALKEKLPQVEAIDLLTGALETETRKTARVALEKRLSELRKEG